MDTKSPEFLQAQNIENLKIGRELLPVSTSESDEVIGDSDEVNEEIYSRETVLRDFNVTKEFVDSEYNKAMLEPALKILCGETNKKSNKEMIDFVKKYIEKLVEPKDEVDSKDEVKEGELEKFVDPELTARIENVIKFGPDSILSTQYEKLGIIHPEQEKKFHIRVLKISSGEKSASEDSKKKWVEVTGSPTQFMLRSKEKSIIYLSEEDAMTMLDNKKTAHKGVLGIFQHEYRHTQRKFASHNDQLFRLLDEAYTNVVGYNDIRAFMKLMTWTTSDMDSQNFMHAYEQDDEQAKISLLQKWEENFQSEGLLLLGAQKSSEHSGDEEGIPDLPLLSIGGEDNERQRFMESILSLRAGVDKNWLETFKEKITSSKISLMQLEAMRGMGMGKYLKKLMETRATHVQKLVDALDAEMMSRKIAGEESLYQQKVV